MCENISASRASTPLQSAGLSQQFIMLKKSQKNKINCLDSKNLIFLFFFLADSFILFQVLV